MRNTILATAAAFALIAATAPSFAALAGENSGNQTHRQHNSRNDHARCAAILANSAGHQASEVEYCRYNYPP
jgi:hypothetical protein